MPNSIGNPEVQVETCQSEEFVSMIDTIYITKFQNVGF